MFSAAICFLPRIVDLGAACLQFTFPVLDCLLSSAMDCPRFSRVLSLMSQISCLYKADVFPPLVLLATNAHFRCQAVVGAPQVLPTSHASRSHVTSEVQREAAEAYSTMMLLMCNMLATAPAGSFSDPAAASLLMNFVATASAVARHTCDVPCLKQALALSRRALDQVPSSPQLQAALPQVFRRAHCPVATATHFAHCCHCSWLTWRRSLCYASLCIPPSTLLTPRSLARARGFPAFFVAHCCSRAHCCFKTPAPCT